MNSAKTPTGKGSKGAVGLEKLNDRIRLNLPRQWFNGQQKRVSLGLSWTKENVTFAESLAKQMELDWLSGHFDLTLAKYLPSKKQQLNNVVDLPGKRAEMSLLELWDRWCEYRKNSGIKITTYKITYCVQYRNYIKDAEEAVGDDVIAQCNWLIENRGKTAVINALTQLSYAHNWGIKQGFVSSNPYEDLVTELKKSKAIIKGNKRDEDGHTTDDETDEENDRRAFSLDEVEAIINAYETSKTHSYYTPLVKFLFWTGCRSGEACALRWKHIKQGLSVVSFKDSYNSKIKTTGDTKTYTNRIFRIAEGGKLHKLLKQLESERLEPENSNELVFKGKTGKQVAWLNFFRTWKGAGGYKSMISELIEQGKVKQYLKPYATRHTFITYQINKGMSAHTVAALVGNSADVIWKHYFDEREKEIPAYDF
ncbi:integrase family protein [Crinalium epipsammum PCC 9333]|uniref:Integrase family protein n=1 Tax=Crinalium epipsammum PCC 9333 TaxID=1173022 RepID=K9VZR6_9CYAN|nr:tyrosine-type recombinase/integrase [Crinalium epipsammum]AFZ13476.1 integrase family protein [Crinalium epipsammum PCC 9333]